MSQIPASAGSAFDRLALPGAFFASGAAALIYQLCWQRLLFGAFGIDVESITIVVSTFMLGLGLGAVLGGQLADRWPAWRLATFALCELGIGLFGLASHALIGELAFVLGSAPRAVVATANFTLLLVPTTLMGATLPILVAHAVQRTGSVGVSIGRLYFLNTAGAASGALAIGTFLFNYLGLSQVLYLAAAINFVVATSVWIGGRAMRPLVVATTHGA